MDQISRIYQKTMALAIDEALLETPTGLCEMCIHGTGIHVCDFGYYCQIIWQHRAVVEDLLQLPGMRGTYGKFLDNVVHAGIDTNVLLSWIRTFPEAGYNIERHKYKIAHYFFEDSPVG
ncbi:unnamed protein product [Sphagnum balticum]